jgi:hypothetical protein
VIVTPCCLINDYRHFSRTSFLNSHIVRLKMEAAGSSETVIIANEATRYRNPVDHRVNLSSLEQWFRVLLRISAATHLKSVVTCANFHENSELLLLLLLLLLILLLTAIELSLGGSSPYTSTIKTNKNKYIRT